MSDQPDPVDHVMLNPDRNPYAMTPQNAYLLGALLGLLTEALEARTLSVSPVADQHGNYLSLLRFTFEEDGSPTYSWVMRLVVDE